MDHGIAASQPPAVYDDDSDNDDEPPLLVELQVGNADATAEDPSHDLPPCPVTILSGFLGSGKTTLINYILKSPNHGKRIAVIENEFGQGLAIESLIARDGVNNNASLLTDLIELPNGCICCTVKDTLVTTLESLLTKRQDLDYIIIECSGMANPGPIASLFWLDAALESRLRLDGIVTLVDAKHVVRQLATTLEAAQQVAYADRILLNKIDLLETNNSSSNVGNATFGATSVTTQTEALMHRLRAINPTAEIRATQFSAVPDLDWILEAQCFDPDRLGSQVEQQNVQPILGDSIEEHHHDHSHDHDRSSCPTCTAIADDRHIHTDAVTSISLTETGRMDLERVHKWLASILWPHQDEPNKVLNALIRDINNISGNANDNSNHESSATSNNMYGGTAHNDMVEANPEIFRIKGVVAAASTTDDSVPCLDQPDPRRHIVQAVHDLWEIHPASDNLQWKPDEELVCKLVVIGRYLPQEELRAGFRSCLVE